MKTKFIKLGLLITTLLLLVLLVPYQSCKHSEESSPALNNTFVLKFDASFMEDPDFIKAWDIMVDNVKRFATHSIDSICDLAAAEDTFALAAFLNYTDSELEILADTLEAIAHRLLDKFPELEDIADTTDCHCGGEGNSGFSNEPICNLMEYLEDNNHLDDIDGYYEDIYDDAYAENPIPKWVACLPVCMLSCLPLVGQPPLYILCIAYCEILCSSGNMT